jgi:uncharacterized protein YecT (DUF1311 family)
MGSAARAESYGVGNITGVISMPGGAVPALRIYAIAVDRKTYRTIETPANETRFTITDVPAGRYHVVGYPYLAKDGSVDGAVAWTRAARCIKGPCDHSLIEVKIVAAKNVEGVLLADWYVPANLLPPDPATVREKPPLMVDCEKEKTQAGRDGCHQRAFEEADRMVNRHFERVMRALERFPKCHEDLRDAQYAWGKYRDQHCAYEGIMGAQGRTVRCLREMTETRAIYLQGQSPVGCNK